MTWVKLDDRFPFHRKVLGLTDRAFRAHITVLCWTAAAGTDGAIDSDQLRGLGIPVTIAQQLCAADLWERHGADGWAIHDFLTYNPPAAPRAELRAVRAAAGRRGGQRTQARRQAKAKQHGEQPDEQPESKPSTPYPYPVVEPLTTTPTPRSATEPDSGGGQRQSIIDDAIEILVRQAQTVQIRHGGPIANPTRWRATVAARLRSEHLEELNRLMAAEPTLDALDLATGVGGGSPFDLADRRDELVLDRTLRAAP